MMDILSAIREKITQGKYEFSKHAVDQSIIRNIDVIEIQEAISNRSKIIEDYPDDKYGASCLDRKSTRLNSSHIPLSRMPSSA